MYIEISSYYKIREITFSECPVSERKYEMPWALTIQDFSSVKRANIAPPNLAQILHPFTLQNIKPLYLAQKEPRVAKQGMGNMFSCPTYWK